MLAMANHRDGGVVVVGVEEEASGALCPVGVSKDDLATWKHDHLADAAATHTDPPLQFDLQVCPLDGLDFLVIEVKEFSDTPVLCKKHRTYAGQVVLREGACYIRPRRKPESVEVCTYADMRDLLDLATEKALRRFLRTAHSAGIGVDAAPTDAELFRQQLAEFE